MVIGAEILQACFIFLTMHCGETFVSNAASVITPPSIVVVGSINMDLVAKMSHLPRPGETVSGQSFQTIPGGKGANQAVAAARLGAQVTMIGRVGTDAFGVTLRQGLTENSVDTRQVQDTPDCSSGVALIGVESSGANSIVVIPGANGRLTVHDIESRRDVLATAAALIVQLETPLDTVIAAVKVARELGVLTVLDPAPMPDGPLPVELIGADIISPNQTEAEALTGIVVNDWQSAEAAARALQQMGARDVVMKLGSLGALVVGKDKTTTRVDAVQAKIVDTTAAGDAFTAAMTVACCEGKSLIDATRWGCLAGTLACTRFGAQPAMPDRGELEEWSRTVEP